VKEFWSFKMKTLNAKNLNDRVEILRSVKISDEAGGFEISWLRSCEVWCDIEQNSLSSNSENFEGGGVKSQKYFTFLMRYIPNVSTEMRLKKERKLFEILAMTENKKADFLQITAREIL
jgi:SPP1 family predicted phage head-tail adaptor